MASITTVQEELRRVTFELQHAHMAAEAKEELAKQLFYRLVRMGVKAELFKAEDEVTFERGILTVDAYLGIADSATDGKVQ